MPSSKRHKKLKRVFVVHGRNLRLRDSMFGFIRALGYSPIEWHEVLCEHHDGSPHIGIVLRRALKRAVAAIVIMSAEDEARLKPRFRDSNEREEQTLLGQPRANVLFESGMALGMFPSRTILVQVGEIRPFSDIAGRYVFHLDNTVAKREALAKRLSQICDDTFRRFKNRSWERIGDFSDYPRNSTYELQTKVASTQSLKKRALPPYRSLRVVMLYEILDASGNETAITFQEKLRVLREEIRTGGTGWGCRPYKLKAGFCEAKLPQKFPQRKMHRLNLVGPHRKGPQLYDWEFNYTPPLVRDDLVWVEHKLLVKKQFIEETSHDNYHAMEATSEMEWRIRFPRNRPAKRWWGTVRFHEDFTPQEILAQSREPTQEIVWRIRDLPKGTVYYLNWEW